MRLLKSYHHLALTISALLVHGNSVAFGSDNNDTLIAATAEKVSISDNYLQPQYINFPFDTNKPAYSLNASVVS
ncbi:hypothetical protein, partial [Brumicola blandensis]